MRDLLLLPKANLHLHLTGSLRPATLAELARAVALEVCPSSYPPLGVLAEQAATPVRALLAAGVPVALGTDDPLLFRHGLADQYATARIRLGCSDAEPADLARHSITASAAPPAVQMRLLAGVDNWLVGMQEDIGRVAFTEVASVTDGPRPAPLRRS